MVGAGLALIAAVPDVDDEDVANVIYAAWRDADLVGVNDVFHGPTGWVVVGGGRAVASGDLPGPVDAGSGR